MFLRKKLKKKKFCSKNVEKVCKRPHNANIIIMLVNANFREALSNIFLERVVTFMNHMSTSGQTDTAL